MRRLILLFTTFIFTLPLFSQGDNYDPTITIISDAPTRIKITEKNLIRKLFRDTHVEGFQQSSAPNLIISTGREFSLGLYGFVNLRSAYDLNGIMENLDFIPADIHIPGSYATNQQLLMDASTSRLGLKMISHNRYFGTITSVIEGDFRGGYGNDYKPRLRLAYVTFNNFLVGRNVTTFCDLKAAPTTIDFQGPNAYTFQFNEMIRYSHTFGYNRWVVAGAVEMPQLNAQTTSNLVAIPQRIPDVPIYVQFNWGRERESHIRASGLIRTFSYHNIAQDIDYNATGWAAQLSNYTQINRELSFNGQILYGEGITPYVNDLMGSDMDLVASKANPNIMRTPPVFGWFANLQYNICGDMFISGGYSQVRQFRKDGIYQSTDYRLGQYCFGNIFCNLTPSLQIAMEYLRGNLTDMNMDKNHANRIQAMVQYTF